MYGLYIPEVATIGLMLYIVVAVLGDAVGFIDGFMCREMAT